MNFFHNLGASLHIYTYTPSGLFFPYNLKKCSYCLELSFIFYSFSICGSDLGLHCFAVSSSWMLDLT